MITSQELIAELSRRGYRVNRRLLTKWRADGLLPPLARVNSGLGRRPKYVWDEPDVLDRAILICELLGRHRRVDTALLGTWFAGYEIDPVKVREVWHSQLEKAETAFSDDLVVSLAEHVAKQEAPKLKMAESVIEDVLLETLPVLFTRGFSYSSVELDSEFISKVSHVLSALTKGPAADHILSRGSVELALRFLQEALSLAAIRGLVASATGEELTAAHRRWRELMNLVGRLANAAIPEEASKDSPWAWMSAVAFGRFVILALLYLARRGVGPRIDATLESVKGSLDQNPDLKACFELARRSKDIVATPDDLASNLGAIWDDLDFLTLLPSGAATPTPPRSICRSKYSQRRRAAPLMRATSDGNR